jgi:hypothetical protein
MTKLHDNNAINLIFQLLTGDRPGSNGKNSLLALKFEDISIFEKEGLFALHFSGQSKKKRQLKKIMIPKELAQEILKRKQDHDGEECLFNIGANKKLEEYTQVCPSFELTLARKIAISALFFSKYLVHWNYRSSIIPKMRDNIQ